MVFCSKVATDQFKKLNPFLYLPCEEHGFTFIDNDCVKNKD